MNDVNFILIEKKLNKTQTITPKAKGEILLYA